MSKSHKWEGEDAEEVVKDSWDQDSEEEKSEKDVVPQPQPVKKTHKKDLKKKPEISITETDDKPLTAEEILAEKIRGQKLQEESDLFLAKEIFGTGTKGIETKEEFDQFKNKILNVVEDLPKTTTNYVSFTEDLVHGLCVHLQSHDLKKISTWLSDLIIEKNKLERGEKPKKKPKTKAKIKLENETNYSEYSAYVEDDFDDFI